METKYGPDDFELGQFLNHMSFLWEQLGDLNLAEACLERSLANLKKHLEPGHKIVVSTQEDLKRIKAKQETI